jgi:UDP-GlcNAc:undecaprenyl-phosphate/decaprenyl-phosphate GlcNAc-1-phosphate transferase
VSDPWPAVALVVGSVTGAVLAGASVAVAPRRLVRENRSGRPVPAVLGVAFVAATVIGAAGASVAGRVKPTTVLWTALVGAVVLAAVGLLDDLVGGPERGFREHLGSAVRLRPTTGVLKLAAGVGAAVAFAVIAGGDVVRVVSVAVLVAASTNVWNALDVVPGRSLKWAVVVLALVLPRALASGGGELAQLQAATLGAAAAVLPFDLLERGMLGDAGSNPLGFLVGVALAAVLPTPGVVVAAAGVLVLQVVAETITISRLIESTPPLRWFDRLGGRG